MGKIAREFPFLCLSGTPREIGLAHGSAFAERIHAAWGYYRGFLEKLSDEELETASLAIGAQIKIHFPDLAEEMRAIADGAALDPWKVIALNSRTELLQRLELPAQECTTVLFKRPAILAQNWDFAEKLEKLTVILAIETRAGKILMLSEPGMVGKIGLNSAGLGVSLNRLTSKRRLANGIPVHVLLRAALECMSISEFRVILQRVPLATESAIIVADERGEGVSFEISGDRCGEHRGADEYLVHANHYVGIPEEEHSPPEDIDHSTTRYARAEELACGASPHTVEGMLQILSDRAHAKFPICLDYGPSATFGRSGTISAIIMDLPKRTLRYTAGNPLHYEPVTLAL